MTGDLEWEIFTAPFSAHVQAAVDGISRFTALVRAVATPLPEGFEIKKVWAAANELWREMIALCTIPLSAAPIRDTSETPGVQAGSVVVGYGGIERDIFELLHSAILEVLQSHFEAGVIPTERLEKLDRIASSLNERLRIHAAQPALPPKKPISRAQRKIWDALEGRRLTATELWLQKAAPSEDAARGTIRRMKQSGHPVHHDGHGYVRPDALPTE